MNDRTLPPNAPQLCPKCHKPMFALGMGTIRHYQDWKCFYCGHEERKPIPDPDSAKPLVGAPLPPPQARTPLANEMKELLSDLEGEFDKEIYPEQAKENFDAPDDREYSVTITAGMYRRIGQLLTKSNAGAESAPQEAPLEIINRWISLVENPDFGSVPSKKTLLELLGYVREEIAASKKAAPQEAGARDVEPQPNPNYCFECDDIARCASAETCYGHHEGYPKLRAERGVPLSQEKEK